MEKITLNKDEMKRMSIQFEDELARIHKNDPVNHPAHYAGEIETIEYIRDKLTEDQFVGYCIGNVIKYVSRYRKKGEPAQDLEKAAVYLGWAIEAQKRLEE